MQAEPYPAHAPNFAATAPARDYAPAWCAEAHVRQQLSAADAAAPSCGLVTSKEVRAPILCRGRYEVDEIVDHDGADPASVA